MREHRSGNKAQKILRKSTGCSRTDT